MLSLISLMPTMIKDLRMTLDGGILISPSSKFYCIKSDVSYGVCCMAAVEFAVFCIALFSKKGNPNWGRAGFILVFALAFAVPGNIIPVSVGCHL